MTKKLPGCLPARTVRIELRPKNGKGNPEWHDLHIPRDWTRAQLLKYVRGVHLDETAKILKWGADTSKWVANPLAFSNFKKGEIVDR